MSFMSLREVNLMFDHFMRLTAAVSFVLMLAGQASAQAPLREGQPYAEADKCAQDGMILCEDFDYPQNFICQACTSSACTFQWLNPGISGSFGPDGSGGTVDCKSAFLIPTSDPGFPAQPADSPPPGPNNYVKMMDGTRPEGQQGGYRGCIWSDCNRDTYDSMIGATYKNGNPISNTIHVRFQFYISNDFSMPQTKDRKNFCFQPQKFSSNPSANSQVCWSFSVNSSPWCGAESGISNHGHRDAVRFLLTAASQFLAWPGVVGPFQHSEYCRGEGMGLNNGNLVHTQESGDGVGTCPGPWWGCPDGQGVGNLVPGRIYRWPKGEWHTLEYLLEHGTQGNQDGHMAVWIDGVKIHEDFDLITCGTAAVTEEGDCTVADFFFDGFVGSGDISDGFTYIDNLIFSTSYIGPPGVLTPPNAPTELEVTSQLEAQKDGRLAINININPAEAGSIYHLIKNGSYYSRIPGVSYRDVWVNPDEPQNYEIWEYRDGKPVGSYKFSVDIAS